jgi:subtilisin-like proprotein convertase family protein
VRLIRILAAAALTLLPVAALADACVTAGMKIERATGLNIPIPDQGSISSPAIVLTNSAQLEVHEIVVGVEIEHSFSGDVVITLIHTPPGGPPNDATAVLLERPDGGTCASPLVWGGQEYQFGDSSQHWFCGLVPSNQVCADPAFGDLDDFDGIRGGEGTWWLSIQDTQFLDVGVFHGWTLYATMGPIISVEDTSWGQVKAKYSSSGAR